MSAPLGFTFQFSCYHRTKMTFKANLQIVVLHAIFQIFNIGTVFGLTTFYYSGKHKLFFESKFLRRYSKFIAITFIIFYPMSVLKLLINFDDEKSGVTDFARNSVFVGNWLMCTLIYMNHVTSPSIYSNLYNRANAIFIDITSNCCNGDSELNLSAKCALKTIILAIGFLFVNIGKFHYRADSRSTIFEKFLFGYLFMPSLLITLTSNRFYVAANFFLYLVTRFNNSVTEMFEGFQGLHNMKGISVLSNQITRLTCERIRKLSINYANLHQLFLDFHKVYEKYIVLILGFSFLNVVFEVSSMKICPMKPTEHLMICNILSTFSYSSTFYT